MDRIPLVWIPLAIGSHWFGFPLTIGSHWFGSPGHPTETVKQLLGKTGRAALLRPQDEELPCKGELPYEGELPYMGGLSWLPYVQ